MNYISYLKEVLSTTSVYDEALYNYPGEGTVYVVKGIGGGTNYADSKIQPVLIQVYTDDIPTTKALLETFAQTYSLTSFWEDLEFIKQVYSTPFLGGQFQSLGGNHYSTFILTGTLIISSNISDIKTVTIDDYTYVTTQRDLVYNTLQDTEMLNTGYIADTDIKGSILQFIVSMENKNNDICTKASRIRQGTLDSNTNFTIKLTFSDNDRTETYTMKLHSTRLDSTNSLSPVMTMTFIK